MNTRMVLCVLAAMYSYWCDTTLQALRFLRLCSSVPASRIETSWRNRVEVDHGPQSHQSLCERCFQTAAELVSNG